MNNNDREKGGELPPNPETNLPEGPRIYVASLSDYNNGILHGQWLDAAQSTEQLSDATTAMRAASPTAAAEGLPAEEWAIHDYEGFGPLRIDEYESLGRVARIAAGIAEHGMPFAHWISYVGTTAGNEIEQFEEHYHGQWQSTEDYAEHVLDDLGYIDEIERVVPQYLRPYVKLDIEGFAHDLELSGDIWSADAEDGGVYLFDARG